MYREQLYFWWIYCRYALRHSASEPFLYMQDIQGERGRNDNKLYRKLTYAVCRRSACQFRYERFFDFGQGRLPWSAPFYEAIQKALRCYGSAVQKRHNRVKINRIRFCIRLYFYIAVFLSIINEIYQYYVKV